MSLPVISSGSVSEDKSVKWPDETGGGFCLRRRLTDVAGLTTKCGASIRSPYWAKMASTSTH